MIYVGVVMALAGACIAGFSKHAPIRILGGLIVAVSGIVIASRM